MPILPQFQYFFALSWGRTIQLLTEEFSPVSTENNLVFPLFGATDQEQTYFLSNELAKSFGIPLILRSLELEIPKSCIHLGKYSVITKNVLLLSEIFPLIFFDLNGQFLELYENTLCASRENLKKAKETVAIACGKTKMDSLINNAIKGIILLVIMIQIIGPQMKQKLKKTNNFFSSE